MNMHNSFVRGVYRFERLELCRQIKASYRQEIEDLSGTEEGSGHGTDCWLPSHVTTMLKSYGFVVEEKIKCYPEVIEDEVAKE